MIVCVGTTPTVQRTMTFARLEIDAVNRATETVESASGKSLNVARVLTTLGESCIATGFLGGDTGEFIRRDMDCAKIPHDFVNIIPHTRTCTTILDRSNGQVTELVEESKAVEVEAWAKLQGKIESLLKSAKLMVLSGSLTPGAPQDFYKWCVGAAGSKKIRTIVDASGEPLKLALGAKPFLVKPNRAELARTVGTDDVKEGIGTIVQAGAAWCIVTMGKEGSLVSDGRSFWRITTPEVKAISPIGSGDAYAAGLAAALARGEEPTEAAKLAAACAAANTLIPVPGHLRRVDVDELLGEIEVKVVTGPP